ncbi:hypothetical protein D3C80_1555260 [compost metagenome]
MANVLQASEQFAGQCLPGLCVRAFLRFQFVDGAIVEPGACNRGQYTRGIPGRRPDAALQGAHHLRGRGDEAHAQPGGDTLGQPRDIHRPLRRQFSQRWGRLIGKEGVGGILDEQQVMLACNGH